MEISKNGFSARLMQTAIILALLPSLASATTLIFDPETVKERYDEDIGDDEVDIYGVYDGLIIPIKVPIGGTAIWDHTLSRKYTFKSGDKADLEINISYPSTQSPFLIDSFKFWLTLDGTRVSEIVEKGVPYTDEDGKIVDDDFEPDRVDFTDFELWDERDTLGVLKGVTFNDIHLEITMSTKTEEDGDDEDKKRYSSLTWKDASVELEARTIVPLPSTLVSLSTAFLLLGGLGSRLRRNRAFGKPREAGLTQYQPHSPLDELGDW